MNENKKPVKEYYVYIISCENNFLYTGITTDYKRRFLEHLGIKSNGAKFTKAYKPKKILALWKTDSKSNALKLEIRIKKLSKENKLLLIENNKYFKILFKNKISIEKYKKRCVKDNYIA